MTLNVERWTEKGPVVSARVVDRDSSGISMSVKRVIVAGKKSWRKLDKSPEPSHELVDADGSLHVALKAGHAYRISSGDAVIETDVLESHVVLQAPGDDPIIEAGLPDQGSEDQSA